MPRSGGESDKLGDRYEGVWIVDALLDVLNGDAISVTVEPFDAKESRGIEFIKELPDGTREFHSAKRQKIGNIWSLADLTSPNGGTRSIIADFVAKIRAHPNATAVFVSGTTPNELNELCERAQRSQSVEVFSKQLEGAPDLRKKFEQRILPLFNANLPNAYFGLRRCRIAGGPEAELIRRVEQRIRKDIYRPDGNAVDPLIVRLLLGEIVYNWFGQPIRRDELLRWLTKNGFAERDWSRDRNTLDAIERRIATYLQHVEAELIDPPIERTEARNAFEVLRAGKKRRVVILGPAGLGKSCTTAQVIRRFKEAGVACLPVRLDIQTQALTARQLGQALDLPESPPIVLAGIACGGESVLIIDQLDALSFASGRNQQLWDAFEELLLEADRYPNMRVLLVCRAFDAEHDPRLRRILADKDRTEEIPLKPLEPSAVGAVLTANQIDPKLISPRSLELLQLPLNLSLYLQSDPNGRLSAFNEHELLQSYWEYKSRLAGNTVHWFKVIERLADWLSEKQTLSAPVHIMLELEPEAERLCTLHVFAREGKQFRFFHESFFDYCWARVFVSRGERLLDFLLGSEQHLFRRAQVRQVLAYERAASPDNYFRDLNDLLTNPNIRYHLKKLTLDWLRTLRDPQEREWMIVETHYPGGIPANVGADILWRSVPWFDLLFRLGVWQRWLASPDNNVVTRAVWLLSMKEIMQSRSAQIAALFAQCVSGEKPWRPEYLGIFQFGEVHHSREIFDLLLWVMRNKHFKTVPERRRWISFHGLPEANAKYAAEFLGVLLDVVSDPSAEVETAFDIQPADLIVRTAEHEPVAFLSVVMPRLVKDLREVKPDKVAGMFAKVTWRMLRGAHLYDLETSLQAGVENAMQRLSKEQPSQLDALTRDLEQIHHPTAATLLLCAWGENGERYSDRIVEYLLTSKEWLQLGLIAWGTGNGHAAISRGAIRAAAPYCSAANYDRLEAAIVGLVTDHETQEPKRRGYTSMLLLECLPSSRQSQDARKRFEELKRKFPWEKFEMPGPSEVVTVVSPIPRRATELMTDEQWLSAMRQYTTDSSERYQRFGRGGKYELTSELRRAAQIEKDRFARLALRMEDAILSTYFEAVLSGITSEKEEPGVENKLPESAKQPLDVESIVRVIERIHALPEQPCGKEISWAIRKIADRNPSPAVIPIIAHYALNDPDPQKESWQEKSGKTPMWGGDPHFQGMNSVRGSAAEAVASLLFANKGHYSALQPTIAALVNDPSVAVRSCVVPILVAMLNFDRPSAVGFFLKLCEGSEAVLGTHYVDQFLHHACYDHYQDLRVTMLRMLTMQDNEHARDIAGRQITVTSFHNELAKEDLAAVFTGDAVCRKAAAAVYAHNLQQLRVADICRENLPRFFDDADKDVRAAASDCFRDLSPDRLHDEQPLIHRFIESQACAENSHDLVFALEKSVAALPEVICRLPERLIEEHRAHSGGEHIEVRRWTYHLPALITRLYEQTRDPTIKTRCLNIIDAMLELGFSEIDTELQKVER
jgi:hypothetical protein